MAGKGQIEPRWTKGESGNPNGRPKVQISGSPITALKINPFTRSEIKVVRDILLNPYDSAIS